MGRCLAHLYSGVDDIAALDLDSDGTEQVVFCLVSVVEYGHLLNRHDFTGLAREHDHVALIEKFNLAFWVRDFHVESRRVRELGLNSLGQFDHVVTFRRLVESPNIIGRSHLGNHIDIQGLDHFLAVELLDEYLNVVFFDDVLRSLD